MYKPKKHQKLDLLTGLPGIDDLRNLLAEGDKAKGCLVELPFFFEKANEQYSLTVQCGLGGGEPVWTFYEGTGSQSRVLWSTPFVDMDLLMDVITLSIPKSVESVELPAHLAPRPENDQEEEEVVEVPHEAPLEAQSAPPPPSAPSPTAAPSLAVAPALTYPYPPTFPPGFVPAPYPPGYMPYPPMMPPGYVYPAYPLPVDQNGQPVYPPPGYPVYPTPYPGYSYPPAPPMPAPGQTFPTAGTLGVQTGPPPPTQSDLTPPQSVKPTDLFKKRPNILLGHFLVEAGLVPEPTLDAALRVQELVKAGAFTNSQAAEAVRRAHQRGGALDAAIENTKPNKVVGDLKSIGPPLGQILIEAGLISISVLKEALRLQDLIRTGKVTQEEACKKLYDEHVGAESNSEKQDDDSPRINRVIRLLVKTGILSNEDLVAARNIRHKNGGKVSKILLSTQKIEQKIFEAAEECEVLFTEEKINLEQATAALKECKKRNIKFRYIADEMKFSF
jgi:hypothetical protein